MGEAGYPGHTPRLDVRTKISVSFEYSNELSQAIQLNPGVRMTVMGNSGQPLRSRQRLRDLVAMSDGSASCVCNQDQVGKPQASIRHPFSFCLEAGKSPRNYPRS